MRPRLFVVLGVLGGASAAVALLRRTTARRQERIELYYDDGSMVSLGESSPDAERLLPLARRILGSAASQS
jgi:hypothetical protein